ncbi:MAG: hypothetical protein KAU03_01550 [Candidatus Altiarchaeales archaeon]|nr:hypothetical protein [Candidatus Altiarchaeales archaeon]
MSSKKKSPKKKLFKGLTENEIYGLILGKDTKNAKRMIDELESPNYKKLLEIEKKGENRKSIEKWLEGHITTKKPAVDMEQRVEELEKRLSTLEKKEMQLETKEKTLEEKIIRLKFVQRKKPELVKRILKKRAGEKEQDEKRKRMLATQIEHVVKREAMMKKIQEEEEKRLESKTPLKEIDIPAENNESMRLFEVLLKKGALRLSEAARELELDKKETLKLAETLKKGGFIKISKPFYGEPSLGLTALPEHIKKDVT